MEIWKDVPEFEGLYMVSSSGIIKSYDRYVDSKGHNTKWVRKGRIMKQHLDKYGYMVVILSKEGKKYNRFVHRLVASAFIPNPKNLPVINHKDEVKTNNFVFVNDDKTIDLEKSNLEWCSVKYNSGYGTCKKRCSETRIAMKKGRPIAQYSKDGVLIRTYYSASEAARINGFWRGNISACCVGRKGLKTAHGYVWKFI